LTSTPYASCPGKRTNLKQRIIFETVKALVKYLEKRRSTTDSLLEMPNDKYTSGTFHKLRVEIKKLNALFELVNFCAKDFKREKTFEPFKLIFRQAGKVRELQLEEAMLKKYLSNNPLNNYRSYIKKLLLKEQSDFFLMVNKIPAARLKNKYDRIVPFLSEVDNKKANRYLEKKENSIKKLLGQSILRKQQNKKIHKELMMFTSKRD